MRTALLVVVSSCLAAAAALAQDQSDKQVAEIAAALKDVEAKLAADPARDELRQMLGRKLRDEIAAANRKSSAEWAKIETRADWERFRKEKLAALRASLGSLPERPAKPKLLVTRELKGEGFRIKNLVYESRPGLVVTANLYVPDPPRAPMPSILLSHSHHNPKHEGELQDMGMTWARAGCYVLVPDHLGHGERRQHPFATAADYDGQFPVSRQDYNFRYDTSLQLYLVGETLMGWLVHDLMTGVDVLLTQPGIDARRIILLGSVAGGGDPAAVTAALDERIACLVPFNFGGPQPENRYPLPADAEASFNYAGSGSWESTRNLYRSAADGFLPWAIVGSVAPRRLIHAHEFSWDREHDPVWKRYEKIWGLFDARDNLAFTTGFGTIQNTAAPASHCNNIGPPHRKLIHEAFRKWFAIDVKPEDEYSKRRPREELTCLTDEACKEFQPKPLHEILAAIADQQLAKVREARAKATPEERRKLTRESWTRLLGDTEPPKEIKVREGSRHVEQVGPITVTREVLETEPGIGVPMLTLSLSKWEGTKGRWRAPVLGVAPDGILPALVRRRDDIANGLRYGCVIALVDVRGAGATNPDSDRGQHGSMASHSATELMLGHTMLGGQLRDLRTAYRHLAGRQDVVKDDMIVAGGTGVTPLAADAAFGYPRRIDGRPRECEPTGAILALLLGLYENNIDTIVARRSLVSYRAVLDSTFVQVPHDCIVPGMFRDGDLPDLAAALVPRNVELEGLVDGRGRLVPAAAAQASYDVARRVFSAADAAKNFQIDDLAPAEPKKP